MALLRTAFLAWLPLFPPQVATAAENRQDDGGVLARALDAIGGARVIDSLTTFVVAAEHVRHMPEGDVTAPTTTFFRFPIDVRHEVGVPGQRMAFVSTIDGGVLVTPEGNVDLSLRGRLAIELPAMRNPVAIMKARRSRDVSFVPRGQERVREALVDLLEMRVGPHSTLLAFDAATGRLLRQSYAAIPGDEFRGEIVITYDDFRVTPFGLVYPFAAQAEAGGRVRSTTRVTGIRINEKLDAALFPAPESPRADVPRQGAR